MKSNCIFWPGTKTVKGYGQISVNRKPQMAHRVFYELFIGNIGDKFVLHKCDKPLCVNPKHLFLGTQKDNIRDMIKKGRRNPNRKVEESEHDKISKMLSSGKTYQEVGKIYGVTHSCIYYINKKKRKKVRHGN